MCKGNELLLFLEKVITIYSLLQLFLLFLQAIFFIVIPLHLYIMKKFIFVLTIMLMTLTATAVTYPASYYTLVGEESVVAGDVNGDNVCTASDVTALYNYILYNDASAIVNGDQNGDGTITASDVTAVYNIILNGGGSSLPPLSITMKEYIPFGQSTSSDHVWADANNSYYGDVIYIALDGVQENMYSLVRWNGKWVLKDVSGSTQAGFKTSGSLKAIWVRGGKWQTDEVRDISIPYDYATGFGSYTCNGTLVTLNFNLTLGESAVYLTGQVPNQIQNMSYCTRVDRVFDIARLIAGETGEGVYSSVNYGTVMHIGSDYVVFGYHYDVNSSRKTVYHATAPYGRSWRKTGPTWLTTGHCISLVNPYPYDGSNGWERDFTMSYYDADDTKTTQLVYPGVTKTIHMIVGSDLSFFPKEGSISNNGTTLSRTSSNSNIVSAYSSSVYNSTSIKALSVGEADVTFTYRTTSTDQFSFKVHVVVEPAVWLAGSFNGKPALYRNGVLKYNSLSVSSTSIDQVFVRNGKAYIRTYDSNNPDAAPYIMVSSNPVYSGSFSMKYNTNMTHFFVTKEGDVWHTNGIFVYKNNSWIRSLPSGSVISDLKQDESSGSDYVWVSGYTCANVNESSSSDVAWLYSNLGGSINYYVFNSDRITTPVGGYQPGSQTHTGPRSPRFGKMTFQYGFVLINGIDVEEHQYRDYNGIYHYSYYNVDKTYTYDASNGFLRQNSVKYPSDFFFEDQTNERVFFLDGSTLRYHYLRSGETSDVNSLIPRLSNMRYCNGVIYAYAYNGTLLIGTTSQFFNGTYKVVSFLDAPSYINDMFIETSVN